MGCFAGTPLVTIVSYDCKKSSTLVTFFFVKLGSLLSSLKTPEAVMWSPLSPMGCFAGTPLVTIVAYGVLRGHPIEGTHWERVRDARHHLVTIFWKFVVLVSLLSSLKTSEAVWW